MRPTRVLIQYPSPFGLREILTVAYVAAWPKNWNRK